MYITLTFSKAILQYINPYLDVPLFLTNLGWSNKLKGANYNKKPNW